MPKGVDIFNWSPRKGATGDDRYKFPVDKTCNAGPSNYSTPPTFTEIQTGSGINQIIAWYNFINFYWAGCNGPISASSLPYLDSNDKIDLNFLNTLRTAVAAKASNYGTTTPNFPVADTKVVSYIQDLRKLIISDHVRVWHSPLVDSVSSGNCDRVTMRYSQGAYPPDPGGTFGVLGTGDVGALNTSSTRRSLRMCHLFDAPNDLIVDLMDFVIVIQNVDNDFGANEIDIGIYPAGSSSFTINTAHWVIGGLLQSKLVEKPISSEVITFSDLPGSNGQFGLVLASLNEVANAGFLDSSSDQYATFSNPDEGSTSDKTHVQLYT